ncbi:MAG: carbohydrate ABC transporter permease [Oscillospiraceae bacterium]|jgi:multiple sugar transport system permease protein|nr:carbohydrate ABC transporter permease [Oscillospiraceae bacterium]
MKTKIISTLLGLICVPVILPLTLLVLGSMTGAEEWRGILAADVIRPILLPTYPTLAPLVEILMDTPEFFHMFWNSCRIAFPAVAGQILVGAPAAWALSRMRFAGRGAVESLYITLMLLPFQVTMVSGYLMLDRLALIDTHWAVILPGIFSPFAVFLMTRGFAGISEELIEAARIDGAGAVRIFISVGLPLGLPGVLSAAVLGFLEHWSMIEQPMTFLKSPGLWPISLFTPIFTAESAGPGFAAALLIAAPPLLLFLYGQHDLERGIAAAGLKE